MSSSSLREVDRFLIPTEDKRAIRFFLDHLFIPHNRREWLWSHLLRWSIDIGDIGNIGGGRSLFRKSPRGGSDALPADDIPEPLHRDLAGVLEAENTSWILLRDYPRSSRKNRLVFFFRAEERQPFAVLKLGGSRPGNSLVREWKALRYLHRRLPQELVATIPAPLAFARRAGSEALLLGFVSGRSLDAEIARRPASPRTVTSHFESAATWLACFHITTRSERVLALDEPRVRLSLSASHGDFWARNVLAHYRHRAMGGPRLEVSGIVDWERFSPEAPPYEDLFHFTLTYALNYPWTPHSKEEPANAFRLAFLEETPLAKAIHWGLSTYCDLTGVPFEVLKALFARYLRRAPWNALGLPPDSARMPAFGESC